MRLLTPLFLLSAACTQGPERAQVEFYVQDTGKLQGAVEAEGNETRIGTEGLRLPTAGYCFVVHVYGPGLYAPDQTIEEGCATGPKGLGKVLGARAYGRTLNVEVEAGPLRTFDILAFNVEQFGLYGHDCSGQLSVTNKGADQPVRVTYTAGGATHVLDDDGATDKILFMARGQANLVAGVNKVALKPEEGVRYGDYSQYSCGTEHGEDEGGGGLTAPTVSLYNPLQFTANNPTITVEVNGVQEGDVVGLYNDSFCSTSATSPVTVPVGYDYAHLSLTLGGDGNYGYYASYVRGGVESPCVYGGFVYTLDTELPYILSINVPSSSSAPYLASYVFSEEVDLQESHITVTNGSVAPASLASTDGITYSFTVIPDSNGIVTLSIADGVVNDLAENSLVGASTATTSYTAP